MVGQHSFYVEPFNGRYGVVAPCKNGTTSIVDWMYRTGTGDEFFGGYPPSPFVERDVDMKRMPFLPKVDGLDVHPWMDRNGRSDTPPEIIIGVVRDPADRVESIYAHFVLTCLMHDARPPHLRKTPSPEEFWDELQSIRTSGSNPALSWHSDPQTMWPWHLCHQIITVREIDRLPEIVGNAIGQDLSYTPGPYRMNQTRQRVRFSDDLRSKICNSELYYNDTLIEEEFLINQP